MNESIEYRNYQINIENDILTPNPYEEWDYLPCIFVRDGKTIWEYMNKTIYSTDYVPSLTYQEIKASINIVQSLIESKYDTLSRLLLSERENFPHCCSVVELVNELLQQEYDSRNKNLYFYSKLLDIKKVANHVDTCKGYSQGQIVDVLVIADDDFCNLVELTSPTSKDLQSYIDLYSAWAWGDTYCYNIVDNLGREFDGSSCSGFYGCNHDESGLILCAKNTIDCEISYQNKQRINKLKTLIKNKVSINLRPDLLSL